MTGTPEQLRDRAARRFAREMAREVVEAGGSPTDVLLLLEQVAARVMAAAAVPGCDEAVLGVFARHVGRIVAEIRLAAASPAGEA